MPSTLEHLAAATRLTGEPDAEHRELADRLDAAGVTVRLAEVGDVAEVCRLVGQLSPMGSRHDYRDAERKFERSIAGSPDYFLWVAETADGIAGTAMMHLQHKLSYRCGTAAHLEDVVVDAAARGRGIGGFLVEVAVRAARNQQCYKLMLTCFEKTAPYYERHGFERHDIGMRLDLKDRLYDEA